MKLTVSRSSLTSALAIVKSVAGRGASQTILGNVHLSVTPDDLVLVCTDLDVSIRTTIEARIIVKGETTVSADMLYAFLKTVTAQDLALELRPDNMLAFEADKAQFELGTIPAKDFPAIGRMEKPTVFDVPQSTLRTLLAQTAFCQGNDISRPVLMGSLLRKNGNLAVVGCDGRRVAVSDHDLAGAKTVPDFDAVLPSKAVNELLRLLSANGTDEKPVTVSVDGKPGSGPNMARFKFDDTLVTTKLLDGAYPDYRKIIPAKLAGAVRLGRSDLLNALRRVHLVSSTVQFELAGQSLTIRSQAPRKDIPGKAVETLLVPKVDAPVTNAFTTALFIDALSAIDVDEIDFIPSVGPRNSAVLRIPDSPWMNIIAPLALEKPAAAKLPAAAAPKPAASAANPS